MVPFHIFLILYKFYNSTVPGYQVYNILPQWVQVPQYSYVNKKTIAQLYICISVCTYIKQIIYTTPAVSKYMFIIIIFLYILF